MKILIFGGTSEGRLLSERLTEQNTAHTLSVATEYGEQILKGGGSVRKVLRGRMDDKAIEELILNDGYELIIDATHPYATEITENIVKAVKNVNERKTGEKVRAIRLKRENDSGLEDLPSSYERAYVHRSMKEAAGALKKTDGNILLTTGSKELGIFIKELGISEASRVYARVIPGVENILSCKEAGIETSHIIAMQGPFSKELNEALIRQYDIRHLVTKDSGRVGGAEKKAEAAVSCGIYLHVIKRPDEKTDIETAGLKEILDIIAGDAGRDENVPGPDRTGKGRLRITLTGIGMGDPGNITREAYSEIEKADVILGALRLINICREQKLNREAEYAPVYKPDETVSYIEDYIMRQDETDEEKSVVILFSGDSGFNSGCGNVYEALKDWFKERDEADIRICPGISSVAYLSSKLKRPYEDAYICSTHGRGRESIYKAAAHVRINSDVYVLTGGAGDVITLAGLLNDSGSGGCIITAAENMSSKKERIITGTAERFVKGEMLKNNGNGRSLYTCHIYNPAPLKRGVTAGLRDGEFTRGEVPMTKEEIRAVTMDKLRLGPESRVLDAGCGTGSVTVEIARLIPDGIVLAFDVNEKAVSLTKENVIRHKLPNVIVKQGIVPDDIDTEESLFNGITHVFIGGNNGRLTDILDRIKALSKSRKEGERIRVVMNVITQKTKDALKAWIGHNGVYDYDVVRIGVSRGDQMIPGNDVYIYSFEV